ncbi:MULTISPECIES: IclR family transcriptional regulator [Pseudorhizobium]|mgnify:CR=1 FL=1|jgi:DNA-binding IclR family transcriptional regulator|uniref:Transcriptional regulator n=1 Tax=Pseudorhizobium pelagicum TaxID=1509405 RepID=A0A922NZ89_9HYPH|nr:MULTISPECIES: IclR family transcriptional regulator [Pseudorhizobium]MBU1312498.1 IclR family transcriptional regulator [Alphaproteobacteria bacterium]KEQ06308.1 transcriptional regulator [Pseudorhizobium pelagicum]KEQ09458.1 transcriptional regulator [Pseudorhizobium pelagicum]MBU1553139.1 IclR family transcriptional regulator [Alphaproteobacteria bacterium]MBU2338114.1 IclR family transcriptional regulator [Alphaproteobacteria bacterium]
MSEAADDGVSKHTIPVIDRMMDVLCEIERKGRGLSISELTEALKLPRTTIYRILNSLQQHDIVYRDDTGSYHLGRRLLSLAAHVGVRATEFDLAALCQPFLDKLAAELGEGVKLSILDQEGILVLAAAQGKREYALTVAPGQRMPIHAGAASKLLLAYLPPEDLDYWLSRSLVAFTAKTITDPKRLRSEFARIRRLGWAQDKGENAPSIQAFATPVFTRSGRMLAAVSVPFLAGTQPSRMEEIRMAAMETAKAISAVIPV